MSRNTQQQNQHTKYHLEGTMGHYKPLNSTLYGLAALKQKPLQAENEPTAFQKKTPQLILQDLTANI